jgi:UDP-N-acetylmuramoyl-tripeptide--D-alanyl-D-alanine ligase
MTELFHNQIAKWLHLPAHKNEIVFTEVSVDTRTICPGSLYIALKGERVDGHAFLADAKAKGAKAAVVNRHYTGPDYGLCLLPVEDPLAALQEIAKQTLARRKTRLVAVTGSIGKTTTKEFIATLLSSKYKVGYSPGNSNSQVGVPLTILNHTTGHEEILVLEMGMTHSGQISRLVQIAPPEVAVITTVALVHACNFNSVADIAWAKAEIFSHPHTRLGILHRDISNYEELCRYGSCRKISFSLQSDLADYELRIKEGNKLYAHVEDCILDLNPLKVPGKHNMHNALAAGIVARHFNISWETILQTMQQFSLPERRLQFIEKKGVLFLNDSYNASELSVKAALETLPGVNGKGKKIAVLGSMLELGKFSEECHRRVGEFALQHVDQLYCLGEECYPIYQIWQKAGKPVQLFSERAALVDALRNSIQPSDVVLLKGSRSKELWKVIEEL